MKEGEAVVHCSLTLMHHCLLSPGLIKFDYGSIQFDRVRFDSIYPCSIDQLDHVRFLSCGGVDVCGTSGLLLPEAEAAGVGLLNVARISR